MLSQETLRRIRKIELRTRKLVKNSFAGAYHSVFKGRGIAFDTVRPYQPGDDIRDIDWNVTARTSEAYIKEYAEERELTVLIVVDSSASFLFGSVKQKKRELAAELGAVLALSATTNNDKVGLMIFSDQIEHYTPPRKGRNHILRIIRDLLEAPAVDKGTSLASALMAINHLMRQRAIVFLLSDFLAADAEYQRELMVTAKKHDLIAVTISDPLERRWEQSGLIKLRDAETGNTIWVDTQPDTWRKAFERQAQQFQQRRKQMLAQAGVDQIDIDTQDDYVLALSRFFQQRSQRR
jgi:uncharacterized protein (DUF58 family)